VHVDLARVGCDLWVLQRLGAGPTTPVLARWAAERTGWPLLHGQDAAWAVGARARHAARMEQWHGDR